MGENELLTTKDVAKILQINEKKVYVLAQSGVLPATKITGKWLFPKNELLEFTTRDALRNISDQSLKDSLNKGLILISGSDDFLLPFIFERFFKKTGNRVFYSNVGSKNGIDDLIYKKSHIALSHIYDFAKKEFNIPYLKEKKVLHDCAVVNLFYREVGFVSCEEIVSLKYAFLQGKKMLKRQDGSGIRMLQNNLIKQEKLGNSIFTDESVNSHFEVGLAVKNDCSLFGITTKSVADFFGLKFKKIFDERFDMIIHKKIFFNQTIQTFLDFIREEMISGLPITSGYSFEKSGRIIYG